MAAVQQLTLLQSLIKRDPESYIDDFMMQRNHFQAEIELFHMRPLQSADRLIELLTFMNHTVIYYPNHSGEFVKSIFRLLENQVENLHPPVRLKLFQSLVVTRQKACTDPFELLKLSFSLLVLNDKVLRHHLSEFIFQEVKYYTKTKVNLAFIRSLQAYLHKVVTEDSSRIARKGVEILAELFRRKIWIDARTVNIIAAACYNRDHKVQLAAIHFFLGVETQMMEDEEEEEAKKKELMEIDKHEHSKKTRKRMRDVEKQKAKLKKVQKKLQEDKSTLAQPIFPALTLIHDPHKLAEYFYKKLKQTGEKFEYKLLLMNIVSQLIGCHHLLLFGFYSFLQRYLTAHQENVTRILAFLVQACHELVPPEELLPVVKSIANNFVSERSGNESITVGINCIREIFMRIPSILLEDDMSDFVQDLAQYSRKSHKIVMAAARSLINLIRDKYPLLLRKGDRGRNTDKTKMPLQYGAVKYKEMKDLLKGEGEGEEEDGWEECSEEDDGEDEDGWQECSDSEGEDEVEDGEEDDDNDEWESVDDDNDDNDDNDNEDDDNDNDDDNEDEDDEEEMQEVEEEVRPKKGILKYPKSSSKHAILSEKDLEVMRALEARVQAQQENEEVVEDEQEDEDEDEDDSDSDDSAEDDGAMDYVIDPSRLLPAGRYNKATKIEKLKKVLSGRNPVKFEHGGHGGGLTNKEKKRKKNYVMVRRGKTAVASKIRMSSGEARKRKANRREQYGRDVRKRRRV